MGIIVLLGQAIIVLGLLITGFGVYAVLRLDGFYTRIVVTSKVEAMGFVTIVIGAILVTGLSPVSIKLAIILLFELLTVSVGAHAIARSAWISGYRIRTATVVESHDD
ncbi:MAG: cation:proton antiporter [Spirochaetaceae bacterium]|nr:MAG: cation:proton antiporter [Spirochaetaceae bacterium]